MVTRNGSRLVMPDNRTNNNHSHFRNSTRSTPAWGRRTHPTYLRIWEVEAPADLTPRDPILT